MLTCFYHFSNSSPGMFSRLNFVGYLKLPSLALPCVLLPKTVGLLMSIISGAFGGTLTLILGLGREVLSPQNLKDSGGGSGITGGGMLYSGRIGWSGSTDGSID